MSEVIWTIVIFFLIYLALRSAAKGMISMVTGGDDEEEKSN
jgi:hypothetical protein